MRCGAMIPLLGESALGCELATGVKLLYQLSFTAFNKTESHLKRYQSNVPFINLDKTPELTEEYSREIVIISG